jgi:N-acetylglucosaminyl-diphospho-decaprenol L-rhamnosyltransferase
VNTILAVCIVFHSDTELERMVPTLVRSDSSFIRLIVVDNAASAATRDLTRRMDADLRAGSEGHRIKIEYLASDENRGYAHGVNLGVAEADGEDFILVINPDLEFAEGSVAVLRESASRRGVGAVGPALFDSSGRFTAWERRSPSLKTTAFIGLHLHKVRAFRRQSQWFFHDPPTGPVEWLSGACIMFRRQTVFDVGGWDERFFMYMEDVDWCRRVRLAGKLVRAESAAVVFHVGGTSSSATPARRYVQMRLAKLLYVEKWESSRHFRTLAGYFVAEALAKWCIGNVSPTRRNEVKGPRLFLAVASCLRRTDPYNLQYSKSVVLADALVAPK